MVEVWLCSPRHSIRYPGQKLHQVVAKLPSPPHSSIECSISRAIPVYDFKVCDKKDISSFMFKLLLSVGEKLYHMKIEAFKVALHCQQKKMKLVEGIDIAQNIIFKQNACCNKT